jgi:hypothetical protein
MTTGGREAMGWPHRWELTAPESHVIEYRGGANRDVPFRLAVKELATSGVLSAQRTERGLLRPPSFVVTDGPRIEADVAPVLEPVRDVYRKTPPRSARTSDGSVVCGVLMRDLTETAGEMFDARDWYLDHYVIPALVERGLLEQTERRGFGSRPEFDWTDAGRDADRALADWLKRVRDYVASGQARDSAAGRELLTLARSAVLLVEDFDRELAALGRPAATYSYLNAGVYGG